MNKKQLHANKMIESTFLKSNDSTQIQANKVNQNSAKKENEKKSNTNMNNANKIDKKIVNQQKQQSQDEIQQQIQANKKRTPQQIEKYKQQQSNKGICYISRIPPYMKPNYIRKLLSNYDVQRIYLLKQSEWLRKNRIKSGGNKRICFEQGWIEFSDKRMAKLAALTLNGQKMVNKKHNFYSQDIWNLKYLPKFKWHHLTQKLAHQQRMKKQKLKIQLQQQKKIQQFYSQNIFKSKKIKKIIQKKQRKGKQLKNIKKQRRFQQTNIIQQEKDQ